jgi:hypothetical protein
LDESLRSFFRPPDSVCGGGPVQPDRGHPAIRSPYTAYGYNSHFRGGAELDVWEPISVGVAGYDIVPFGNQTIIPRGRSNDPHIPSQKITGRASLAKDDGFSMWVDGSPNRYLDAELGFTRSVPLDLNTVSFSIGLNVASLMHKSR